MAVQLHFSRAKAFRSICWIVLGACFSPSQEEKRLVNFDDAVMKSGVRSDAGPPAPGAGLDASAVGTVDGAAGAPGAAPMGGEAGADSSANAPPGQPDAAGSDETGPAVDLLFPSNCMAPWEDKTKYHPDGYGAAKVHGLESNLNKDNCVSCHGAKLEGCANSPSCDNCHDGGHPKDWRKDCKYCHGGKDNDLGAPPRDIDGTTDEASLSFRVHTQHVMKGKRHEAYDCDTCHKKPEDALDPGHMYDDTPEKAEVTFAGGLSKDGMYLGEGSCANLYCHGDAKKPGSIKHDKGKLDCKSCHSDAPTTGQHPTHLPLLFWCSECHADTVDDTPEIKAPAKHVNGKVDLSMPDSDVKYDGKTCTGTCHILVYHAGETW